MFSALVLTVPTRWPARRAHVKVPPPCSAVPTIDGGALNWSRMVWLTVGMYGKSMTEIRQAMFTEMPVTVPARCLQGEQKTKCVSQERLF